MSFLSQLIFVCTIIGGIALLVVEIIVPWDLYDLFGPSDLNRRNEKREED